MSAGGLSCKTLQYLADFGVGQGDGSGLGVFLVAKGSDLDRHVPASAQLEVERLARGEGAIA